MKPSDGWNSSKLACQPNSPSFAGMPNIILGFLDIDAVTLCLSEIFLDSVKSVMHRCEFECEFESEIFPWASRDVSIWYKINRQTVDCGLLDGESISKSPENAGTRMKVREKDRQRHTTFGWVYQVEFSLISPIYRMCRPHDRPKKLSAIFEQKGKVSTKLSALGTHKSKSERYVEVQQYSIIMSSTFIYYCVASNGIFMFNLSNWDGMLSVHILWIPFNCGETNSLVVVRSKYFHSYLTTVGSQLVCCCWWCGEDSAMREIHNRQHSFIIGGLKALFSFHSRSVSFTSSLQLSILCTALRDCSVVWRSKRVSRAISSGSQC